MQLKTVSLLILLVFLTACNNTPKTADEVTKLFWGAMLKQHHELAAGFILPGQTLNKENTLFQGLDTTTLPRMIIEPPHAMIDTVLSQSAKQAESVATPLSFKTYLKQVDGRWLVDWQETEKSLKAHALKRSVEDYGRELNQELDKTVQSLEQLMNEAMKEGSSQMNKALEELQQEMNKALEELQQQRQQREQEQQTEEQQPTQDLPVY